MLHKFEIRTRTFQDLRKHLDKRGVGIESAIAFVKSGTSAAVTKKAGKAADSNNMQDELATKFESVLGKKVVVSATGGNDQILG